MTFKKAHMVDDAQRDRPHRIDKKEVEAKRAMPREVCTSYYNLLSLFVRYLLNKYFVNKTAFTNY